jgi:hypothetical protein
LSWSYDGWIYNYLCNRFLSPLKLLVRTPFMVRCTQYNIMWWSLSVTCDRCHFQQYFSYIIAVSFISGGNQSTRRKPQTCRKSLTNFITWCYIEYTTSWAGPNMSPSSAIQSSLSTTSKLLLNNWNKTQGLNISILQTQGSALVLV